MAGEGGRDRILREEIGGLQDQLSSASAHTYRLSSQLATLSGSIESRLNALSRAFDAYVELGDVLEDLAAYEDPAAVRRDVLATVETIAGGRQTTAVDPRDLDYWLPYAMNAVSALAESRAATEDLERSRSLAPETDLFVVAATGALGRGVAVAVAEAWRPQLDREPATGWRAWVAAHGPTPSSGIDWLRALVIEPRTEPVGTPVDGLRSVVMELIQRGMPAEQDLLRRARELRALIEHPDAARPSAEPAIPSTVVSEVRRALLDPATAPTIRHTIQSWVAPALLRVLDELTTAAATSPPAQETVRGHGTVVVVSAAGVDEVAVQTAEERVRNAYVVPRTPLFVWTVSTAVAALLTLVLGLSGSGWAWLFAILLLVGAIGSVRRVMGLRQTREGEAEALARLRHDVADAVARVDTEERRRTELLVELDGEAADLRRALTALAGDPATGAVSPARDR